MVKWEQVNKPAQAARAALSYERIAAAGIEIADAEGLEAVTMRKVAGQLGAGVMSLYRYVDGRADLVNLMADHVAAEALPPPRSGDWRTDLAEIARTSRRVTLRHPWLSGHAPVMDDFGPNALAMSESTLALIDGYGLDISQMIDMWQTVQAFVQGHVLSETARRQVQDRSGPSAEQPHQHLSPYLREAMASGDFPLLSKAVKDAEDLSDADREFERRLGYLLDGLARTFFPHRAAAT